MREWQYPPNLLPTEGIQDIDNTVPQALIDKLTLKYLGGNSNVVPPNVLAAMSFHQIMFYGMHYAMPAGGLFSTAGDLAKFCRMLLNGGVLDGRRYLSEDAVRQMTSIQTGAIIPAPRDAYGLGWMVTRSPGGYPSVGTFGHRGAASTYMWVDPTHQLVMVLLMQRGDWPKRGQVDIDQAFLRTAIDSYGKPSKGT